MTGREEHNFIIDKRINNLLENSPQIVKDYSYNFGNKTLTTKEVYVRYILHFVEYFKGQDVCLLKKSDINRYMDFIRFKNPNERTQENSASIRNARLSAIKNFYNFLIEDGRIESSPAEKVNPVPINEEKEIVALTKNEMNRMIHNARFGVGTNRGKRRHEKWRNRDVAIIELGCSTGLRCSAISEINLSDIDFNNKTIKVIEKGNRKRIIYLGDKTVEAIQEWIKDRSEFEDINSDALFISSRKTRLSQREIGRMIKNMSNGIDKNISPHKLRSTCATTLYEKTNDIYLVQEVLGHKNIANTKKYAKMSEDKRRQAANIMDKLI